MALVAERANPQTGEREIIGVGRLQGIGGDEAEYAIVISDDYQKQGIGTEFLRRLIDIGKIEGVKVIVADILSDNTAMQKIAEKLGFKMKRELGENVVIARLTL
jgi:acetyltransferase